MHSFDHKFIKHNFFLKKILIIFHLAISFRHFANSYNLFTLVVNLHSTFALKGQSPLLQLVFFFPHENNLTKILLILIKQSPLLQ